MNRVIVTALSLGLVASSVAAQPMGRTRLYTLDPRYFARDELVRYLRRLAQPETDLQDRVAALRRRPRRTGKPA